jgi:hypothetical protein
LAFPISRSHPLVLRLNGRKFGNSVSQFSDATLEIGHGGVTPLFAGLCASIEPHTFFGKLLKKPSRASWIGGHGTQPYEQNNATIAIIRPQDYTTSLAGVKVLASVGGHGFGLLVYAVRTNKARLHFHQISFRL